MTPSGKQLTQLAGPLAAVPEIGFTNNWSVRAETLMPSTSVTAIHCLVTSAPATVFIQNIKTDFHLVTFGVNYRVLRKLTNPVGIAASLRYDILRAGVNYRF